MSSQQSHLRPVTPADGGDAPTAGRQQPRQRAARGLPTDRIKMERQHDIPAAIGRLSGPRKEPINADSLARAVGGGIAPATVILSNRFFADAGWITIPSKGQYAATDPLVDYTRRLATDLPARAVQALHGPVRQSWFWKVLEPHFMNGKVRVNDAEIMLMRAAEASDSHLPMVRNLIAWLEDLGMITVNDQYITVKDGAAAPAPGADHAQAPEAPGEPSETGTEGTRPSVKAGEPTPDTVLAASFDVKITVDDLAVLSAEQIKALFEAVGTIMALRGNR